MSDGKDITPQDFLDGIQEVLKLIKEKDYLAAQAGEYLLYKGFIFAVAECVFTPEHSRVLAVQLARLSVTDYPRFFDEGDSNE